jgi:hypothetical protein
VKLFFGHAIAFLLVIVEIERHLAKQNSKAVVVAMGKATKLELKASERFVLREVHGQPRKSRDITHTPNHDSKFLLN